LHGGDNRRFALADHSIKMEKGMKMTNGKLEHVT